MSENDLGSKGMHHIAEALRENVFITHVVSFLQYIHKCTVAYLWFLEHCVLLFFNCNRYFTARKLSWFHVKIYGLNIVQIHVVREPVHQLSLSDVILYNKFHVTNLTQKKKKYVTCTIYFNVVSVWYNDQLQNN